VTIDLQAAINASGVPDIMDLTVVPFGNANIANDAVTCQHGPDECTGNAIEQCAFNLYDSYTAFPFYECMEAAGSDMLNQVQECANTAGLSYQKLLACYKNPTTVLENQIEAQAATPEDHTYVPWVLIDGLVWDGATDFLTLVCNAYDGTPPAGCPATKPSLRAATVPRAGGPLRME